MRCQVTIKSLVASTALLLSLTSAQLKTVPEGERPVKPYMLPANFTMPDECFSEGTTIETKRADRPKAEELSHFEEVLGIDEWDPTMRVSSVFMCYDAAKKAQGVITDIVDGSGTKTFRLDPLGLVVNKNCDRIDVPEGVTIDKMTIGYKQFIRHIAFELSDGSKPEAGKYFKADLHDEWIYGEDRQFVGFGIEIFNNYISKLTEVVYNPLCGTTSIKEYEEAMVIQKQEEAAAIKQLEIEEAQAEEEREAEVQALREVELLEDEEYQEELAYHQNQQARHLVFALGLLAIVILVIIICRGLLCDPIPEEALKQLEENRRKKQIEEDGLEDESDPYTHGNYGTEQALHDEEASVPEDKNEDDNGIELAVKK